MGCVEQLITILNREHDASHEHVLSTLLKLLSDNPEAVKEAQKRNLNFKQFLDDRRQRIAGKPEYQVGCIELIYFPFL